MNNLTSSCGLFALALVCAVPLLAASARGPAQRKLSVAVVKNDSDGPKYMAEGGLVPLLEKLGCEIKGIETVALTKEDQAEYGAWNRGALESRRIGALVSKYQHGDSSSWGSSPIASTFSACWPGCNISSRPEIRPGRAIRGSGGKGWPAVSRCASDSFISTLTPISTPRKRR